MLESLDKTLNKGMMTIYVSTETILKELEEKTMDSATSRRANIWYPNALHVWQLTKDLNKYLDGLKTDLETESVSQLFETKEQGKELENIIFTYRDSLLAIHQDLNSTFREVLLFPPGCFDSLNNPKQGFSSLYFKNASPIEAIAMLSNFQHTARVAENIMVTFCNNKVNTHYDDFSLYSAFIGKSSSIVQRGETVEITAGVGSFSRKVKPVVTIKGDKIAMKEYGVAVYQFKAPDKPGKYTVPVKVGFINQETGMEEEVFRNIEYTVSDCN